MYNACSNSSCRFGTSFSTASRLRPLHDLLPVSVENIYCTVIAKCAHTLPSEPYQGVLRVLVDATHTAHLVSLFNHIMLIDAYLVDPEQSLIISVICAQLLQDHAQARENHKFFAIDNNG